MRLLIAALLHAAPLVVHAACFSHPDTGVLYCSSAAECGSATWNPATQACTAATRARCTGSDSGTYTPASSGAMNAFAQPRKAFWTRLGAVVTVAGTVDVLTTGGGVVLFYLAPPIGTGFASEDDAAGVGALRSEDAVGIAADPASDALRVVLFGAGQQNYREQLKYTYAYRIADCP
jgi:hypothetical protein